ncbi:MAG TPA: molybdate ABC transporter substrate-binding protein [Gammaproteobacteria bacterium]|nr:molybdate ABC transporter substrate-binding protein [Gammaproteobacteria bacterium]
MKWMKVAILGLLFTLGQAVHADTLVFAAASLTNVLDDIMKAFRAETGKRVAASYAASSVLAKQIEAGSPAQIFISADQDWMDYLKKRDLISGEPQLLARNQLVMIAPADSTLQVNVGKGMQLEALLGKERLALADPTGVPAGKYARAALEYYGEWSSLADKIIPLDNVRTALIVVETKEAPLGIVYATDAKVSTRVKVIGVFPGESHPPIVYPAALVGRQNAGAEAAAFFAYLRSTKARDLLEKYGFDVAQ